MFTKTVKYDFYFSKTIFFGMAAGMIALAFLLRIIELVFRGYTALTADTYAYTEMEIVLFSAGLVDLIISFTLFFVAIISVSQVVQFYYKNFFDDTGYLMLTLPVRRFELLASKLLVSIVWFNFMLLTGAIVVYIVGFSQMTAFSFSGLWDSINANNILSLVQVNFFAMFFVTMLFLAVTLSQSVIMRIRVHGGVVALFGLSYTALFFALSSLLTARFRETGQFEEEWLRPIYSYNGEYLYSQVEVTEGFFFNQAILGLRYGRIPIGEQSAWASNYFDIFHLGMTVVFCVLAVLLTYYLLKKRVSLR